MNSLSYAPRPVGRRIGITIVAGLFAAAGTMMLVTQSLFLMGVIQPLVQAPTSVFIANLLIGCVEIGIAVGLFVHRVWARQAAMVFLAITALWSLGALFLGNPYIACPRLVISVLLFVFLRSHRMKFVTRRA